MGIMETLGLKKDEYHNKIKAEMSKLDADSERALAEHKRNAANQETDRDEDYEAYRSKRATAEQKLSDLRNVSEEKWEDMKTGVEKAWLDAKNAFAKLGNRVRH